MKFKIGFILAAAATLIAAPASAQYYDYDRRNDNDQLAGAAVGAVAGGLLGSAIAGNSSNTEGTIAGAVIGGIAGAAIAGDGNRGHYRPQGHYNGGYYDRSTGYYGGGYQTSSYPTTYYNQGYRTSYPTTYYGHGYRTPSYGYYSRPRSSISINIGSGGYYGHRPYYRPRHYRRGRGYYSRPHYRRTRHHRRRHHHRRHH